MKVGRPRKIRLKKSIKRRRRRVHRSPKQVSAQRARQRVRRRRR